MMMRVVQRMVGDIAPTLIVIGYGVAMSLLIGFILHTFFGIPQYAGILIAWMVYMSGMFLYMIYCETRDRMIREESLQDREQ